MRGARVGGSVSAGPLVVLRRPPQPVAHSRPGGAEVVMPQEQGQTVQGNKIRVWANGVHVGPV